MDTADPIEITITFTDLTPAAQQDFADYYRQGALIVTAKGQFDASTGYAAVKQFGNRLAMAEFAPFFKSAGDGAKVADLKVIFAQIRASFPGVETGATKDAMINALRAYETARPEQCALIPSEDQFYGISQGQGLLRKYIQWVYVPAVKDAAGEQSEGRNTALGKLLARTVRAQVNFNDKLKGLRDEAENSYREMLDVEQTALDKISTALQDRLTEWSHPDATAKLKWHQDPKTSIRIEEPMARLLAGDGEFEGSIARFGHGLQRSYIIALLQGLAADDDADSPRLLLGIEEPELYQHPPQARHLAAVLQTLSEKNSQIVVSTHSPFFVDGAGFERVRLIRKLRGERRSIVTGCSLSRLGERFAMVTGEPVSAREGILAKLHQVMQPSLSEMFFTPRLILTEGLEDVAYIHAWLVLTGQWAAFRKHGCQVIAANGKSELLRPLIIAGEMGIPVFVLFDCDSDKIGHSDLNTAKSRRVAHERDNRAVLALMGCPEQDPFPTTTLWHENFAAWPNDLEASVKAEVPPGEWEAFGNTASATFGGVGGLKKNTLHIAARLKCAFDAGLRPPTLDRLCESISAFGAKAD